MSTSHPSAGGPRPLVIVKREIADDEMRAILDEAGYAMVPGNPEDFHVVRVTTLGEVEFISRAAMEIIRDARTGGSIQASFGFKVARALAQPPLPAPAPAKRSHKRKPRP